MITSRCKLDLSMGYMVIRGDETKRVFLEEIAMLIIENPAVSMTGCLLSELTKRKIRIIFCDEKRTPYGELQPYSGCHDSSRKIRTQIVWTEDQKKSVWTEIAAEKIRNQAQLLYDLNCIKEGDMLIEYVSQMQYGDESNREGHAAKVYFNALFGKDFSRGQENPINAALNYGYSILLSTFNKEVTANGYLTQLGLFHDNMFNPYNLSCDLMEPFRIMVDRTVIDMEVEEFTKDEKYCLLSMLNEPVTVDGNVQTLLNAIKIYTKSVFNAINDSEISLIRFAQIL
jgi:CRISPR-associated endonuclease Cas1 subtype II